MFSLIFLLLLSFRCGTEVLMIVIVITYATPMFVTVIIPLGVVYFFLQKYYITSSRQLKRLESISKSPIFRYSNITAHIEQKNLQ